MEARTATSRASSATSTINAAGGLIARVRDERRLKTYREFAESEDVDLAYRIGPDGEDGAFLYFRLVVKPNAPKRPG